LSAGRDEDWSALKLAHYWNLWRFVPAEKRQQVIRAAKQPLPLGGRCFDIGEFRNWEQLELKYRQLAEELGHAGKIPSPGEIEFLHRMVDRDGVRYPGGIGSRDYFFLTCLVSILAPRRVIEIGTLTGFSTAIIAAAIYHQHGVRDQITVDTVDSQTHCIIDKSRPVGFEIPDLIPDLISTVRIHTSRASDVVPEIASPGEFGLAFIDADHRHPWPLLDVLRLAPYIQSGGWIILHDIQLGSYGRAEREAGRSLDTGTPYGAEWLFERWPFRKIRSFHIGAVELPQRLATLIPFALELVREPFEITGKTAIKLKTSVYRSLADLVR
jgi:predicted O-methyltransferase YrrM